MEILHILIYLGGLLGFIQSFLLHRDICDEIMFVDCKTEALPGNKLYRDNNGTIYDNFCSYSQAKCRDSSIDLESICTCVHPMIRTPVTPDLPTTSVTSDLPTTSVTPDLPTTSVTPDLPTTSVTPDLPTTSSTLTPTQEFITTLATANFSTQPKVSPTVKPTMALPTQNVTTQDALISLFCENKDITCSKDPDPMCGSDNTTYNNRCEFNKVKCNNSNLSIVREGDC